MVGPPISAFGTTPIGLFPRPPTADRRAASPRIRAASLPTQRPSIPKFAMPQSEPPILEDIAAPSPATRSRAYPHLRVAETRLCPTVPPEVGWDRQRRPGCGAAPERVASPTSMALPLPITEAGPHGARIKRAVRATPVSDEDGHCKGACLTLSRSRHRLSRHRRRESQRLISTLSAPSRFVVRTGGMRGNAVVGDPRSLRLQERDRAAGLASATERLSCQAM
jgi:hypothetical protein